MHDDNVKPEIVVVKALKLQKTEDLNAFENKGNILRLVQTTNY